MARTANTTPFRHRNGAYNHVPDCASRERCGWRGYWTDCVCPVNTDAHTVLDLRYSRAALAEADASGRRPVPEPTTTRMPRDVAWGRLLNNADNAISYYARAEEKKARARLRDEARATVHAVNAHLRHRATTTVDSDEDTEDVYDVCDEVDLAPARHRHSAIWLAW